MLIKYRIENLDCLNCAEKIESHLKTRSFVKDVSVDYASAVMLIDTSSIEAVRREIKKLEPDVDIFLEKKGEFLTAGIGADIYNVTREAWTIAVAVLLFLILLFNEQTFHQARYGFIAEYTLALTAYFLAGWNVLKGAIRTILRGSIFDEFVLMTIATVSAFSIHAVSEAVGVMIFFKVGEFLQNLAVSRSRNSIRSLLEIRPQHAAVKTVEGIKKTTPEKVNPKDLVVVKPGEKIPLDGIVKEGLSLVNTSALTGESVPVNIKPGDLVLAGEVNISAMLTIEVTKPFAESSISKILDLVEKATAKKAKTEQFIKKFARYYTPAVVFLSISLALFPPLLFSSESFEIWFYRALVLLVISCPCALVISVPLGYFGGIGGASRRGILIKGSNFIDALSAVKTVVFDKTGTLTKGEFKVKEIVAFNGYNKNRLLYYAALAETGSNHPIARSVIEASVMNSIKITEKIVEHKEMSGFGVKARTPDHVIIAGNDALLHKLNIKHDLCNIDGTVVHVVVDNVYAGYITIGDELKKDAQIAVEMLRSEKVENIFMLTGDNRFTAKQVADKLGISSYHAELLPEEKVAVFEKISRDYMKSGKTAFVGDGINDAPVLAQSDVGIAMGALGSDAAIETSDVVLMTDHPSKAAEAIKISKKTREIVWQNIVLALAVKIFFISFGAFGLAGMWEAVFADMGTAIIAVLNSTRALRIAKNLPSD
ncbi:MAG: cadmium-translocating P-type ATPase [Fibrobacter sp.]|nr:cadmium-translocating P-type ATPase [Fibrobacter sp.]